MYAEIGPLSSRRQPHALAFPSVTLDDDNSRVEYAAISHHISNLKDNKDKKQSTTLNDKSDLGRKYYL